jgi:chromosome segregation ATPase
MMAKVLLYGYCIGMPSSRKIDKAMVDEVAFRVLGVSNFPDFRTISEFRRIHLGVLKELFVQVLDMCRVAGLVKLGVISLDGTKVKANASLDKNRTYESLSKEEEQLQRAVEEMLQQAQEADDLEDRIYGKDRRGDELPPEFQKRKERLERIKRAKEELEQRRQDKQQEYETKLAERIQKEETMGKKLRGRKLKLADLTAANDTKRNTTDTDSRIMKSRHGYIQGYNAQIATDCSSQVILAADVTQECNDLHQLVPMMEQVEQNIGQMPDKGTLDAGYWCEEDIQQIQDRIDLYIATTKDWKQRKLLKEKPSPRGRIPNNITLRDRMERKLQTQKGHAIYKQRGSTVEPVIGQIKEARGFKRFLLKGIAKVQGEWKLICTGHNILKLWRNTPTST